MISFRFHIVSMAAVFMALALGIVLGTAFLNDATVNQLETSIKKVRAENKDLSGEVSAWRSFGDDAEDAAVEDRLSGARVLMIVPEGIVGDVTDRMRSLLAKAGAVDAGTLTLDNAWEKEPPPTDDIAGALGIVGPNSIVSVTNTAAARLADEFAVGGGPTLPSLIDANLVRLDAGDPGAIPGSGAKIVVIDGGAPTGLLEPLTRALAEKFEKRVLVADAGPDDVISDSLVGLLRRDAKGAQFSTVDHIRTAPGRIAAILALRDFDRGVVGDYGSCCGADRAAPAGG